MRSVVLVVLVLVASGCLQRGEDRPDFRAIDEEAELLASPLLSQDHGVERGHYKADLHEGAFNMELVGYSNGVDNTGKADNIPAGGTYNELAVTDDYAYQVRSSADGTFGGFVIYDIRNASRPFPIGEFVGQPGADIEINADETLAFMSTQRNDHLQMSGALTANQDPTTAFPRGIYVVDISDKTHPTFDSFIPLPINGPHTLTYHNHDGDGNEYLIACTYDLISDPATGALVGVVPVTQRVIVYMITNSAAPVGPQAALTPVSEFQITDSAPDGQLFFPHDTRVQSRANDTLLYVAYWDKGLQVLDFNTPSMTPVLQVVGSHTEFSPSALNALHLAQPFEELIDGRHITVAEPEIIAAPEETGQITFLDTTNPADIERLGHWTLPESDTGQLGVNGFDFSPHNFDTWDGKVTLGHNHAGVWVIDVSDDKNLADPKTVGWYLPSKPRADSPTMQPSVWAAYVEDGLTYVTDGGTGLYILRYTGP